jgi:predicted nucleic acid-binding Zn ribbon protein
MQILYQKKRVKVIRRLFSREIIKEQLRGSIEVIVVTFAVIIGLILSVELVAETAGDRIIETVTDNYGPNGLFNLGLPDIFWILLVLSIISLVVKFVISLIMPTILPFYGFCPKCGVKPLADEAKCSDCGCSLYRKRISKFDLKMYFIVTFSFAIFVIIWYILSQIVGIRVGVDPGR